MRGEGEMARERTVHREPLVRVLALRELDGESEVARALNASREA